MSSTNTTRIEAALARSKVIPLLVLSAFFALFPGGVACGGRLASADAHDGGAAPSGPDAAMTIPHRSDDGRDAAPAILAVPAPPERDQGCGLGVNGALQASLTGVATASPAGSEIPFVLVRCTASALQVDYEVIEQVVEGRVNQVVLNAGTGEFTARSPCTTTLSSDGDAQPYDAVGEHVRTTAKCAALEDEADGRTVSLDAWIATVITPRE